VILDTEGTEVGILAYGSSHWAVIEARDQLAAAGVKSAYCLLKAFPFNADVEKFLSRYPRIYVVEQNRDGQMAGLLKLEFSADAPRIRSVLHYNGMPIDARSVSDEVLKQEGVAAEALAEGAAR
jgi:2-oxoglutarate/2-oxoacid ferredoxin oxidoreductase subunit alpha